MNPESSLNNQPEQSAYEKEIMILQAEVLTKIFHGDDVATQEWFSDEHAQRLRESVTHYLETHDSVDIDELTEEVRSNAPELRHLH